VESAKKRFNQLLAKSQWRLPTRFGSTDSRTRLEGFGFTIKSEAENFYLVTPPKGWTFKFAEDQPATAAVMLLMDDRKFVRLRLIYSYVRDTYVLEGPDAIQWVRWKLHQFSHRGLPLEDHSRARSK
jgi:hypothetical protein